MALKCIRQAIRIRIFEMTSAEQLQRHIENLQEGLAAGIGDAALDQLVDSVAHALTKSLDKGDLITVSEIGMKLTTRLQTLNAINQGYKLEVSPSSQSSQPEC